MKVNKGKHNISCLYLLLTYFPCIVATSHSASHPTPHKHIYIPGDVILGGLFTVHIMSDKYASSKGPLQCEGTFSRRAFQAVEAMLTAVDYVNNNTTLLPGIKLGVDIKDTCGTVDFAVKGSLNFSFVRKYFERSSNCPRLHDRMQLNVLKQAPVLPDPETVAIIGPDLSDIARAVSDLAGLFHVPVISHSATSPIFSDRTRFKYFLRTVPSDTYQVRLIVDLLIHYQWNFVILLTSDDEYGRSGRSVLRIGLNAIKNPICTVMDEVITQARIPGIVQAIKKEKRAKVIVVFSNIQYVRILIGESKKQNLVGYTWIASDAWSGAKLVVSGNENVLKGMLGVNPMPSNVLGFREHLKSLANQKTVGQNVWAEEFRQYEREECRSKNVTLCISKESYELSPYISSTMDAVFAAAHAVHNILECNHVRCKMPLHSVDWTKLIYYLENVTFRGISGNTISFDWYGDGLSQYQVQNLRKRDAKYYFATVGTWEGEKRYIRNGSTELNISSEVFWSGGQGRIPKSTCSQFCRKGQRKKPESQHPICCWQCIDCGGNTISNQTNLDMCTPCKENEWPSNDRSSCRPVKNIYLSWDDKWARTIIGVAIFNMQLVFLTIGTFVVKRNTAVVRASSRNLCYILLLGVLLFDLLPFFMISKPTKLTCQLQPFTLGLCFAVNVGTMLVKTNRIARIFSRKLMKTRRARFLSNKWQYLLVSFIVMLELSICLLWMYALHPPEVGQLPYIENGYKVLSCTYSKSARGLAIWSTFNAGLVIICTYQAFLVRKVSSNYNEAKFIALTMITMCIIIIVYIPVYVGTVSHSREIICSFLYIFAGFVEFASIFGPKLYIIILRPEKNIPMRQRIDGMKKYHSPRSSQTSGCGSDLGSYTSIQRDSKKDEDNRRHKIGNGMTLRHLNDEKVLPIRRDKTTNTSVLPEFTSEGRVNFKTQNNNIDFETETVFKDAFGIDGAASFKKCSLHLSSISKSESDLQHFVKDVPQYHTSVSSIPSKDTAAMMQYQSREIGLRFGNLQNNNNNNNVEKEEEDIEYCNLTNIYRKHNKKTNPIHCNGKIVRIINNNINHVSGSKGTYSLPNLKGHFSL